MAETTLDVRHLPKPEAWAALTASLGSVLEGIDDEIAVMSTISCTLHHGFQNLWTGFYRVATPRLLRVGPYQGTLGCLDIPFGRGVCGTSAAEKRTVIVPDVHAFPGHIACDARSKSEIVVPVLGAYGEVRAVLDIDSDRLAAFDESDARALEQLVARFLPAARTATELEGYARVKIRPGKLAEWKRLNALCMQSAREKDTGTLQYDIFLSADETHAIVHERYRDPAGLLEHTANLGPLMGQMMEVAEIVGEVLGAPSAELKAKLDQFGVKTLTPYLSLR